MTAAALPRSATRQRFYKEGTPTSSGPPDDAPRPYFLQDVEKRNGWKIDATIGTKHTHTYIHTNLMFDILIINIIKMGHTEYIKLLHNSFVKITAVCEQVSNFYIYIQTIYLRTLINLNIILYILYIYAAVARFNQSKWAVASHGFDNEEDSRIIYSMTTYDSQIVISVSLISTASSFQ